MSKSRVCIETTNWSRNVKSTQKMQFSLVILYRRMFDSNNKREKRRSKEEVVAYQLQRVCQSDIFLHKVWAKNLSVRKQASSTTAYIGNLFCCGNT